MHASSVKLKDQAEHTLARRPISDPASVKPEAHRLANGSDNQPSVHLY